MQRHVRYPNQNDLTFTVLKYFNRTLHINSLSGTKFCMFILKKLLFTLQPNYNEQMYNDRPVSTTKRINFQNKYIALFKVTIHFLFFFLKFIHYSNQVKL